MAKDNLRSFDEQYETFKDNSRDNFLTFELAYYHVLGEKER